MSRYFNPKRIFAFSHRFEPLRHYCFDGGQILKLHSLLCRCDFFHDFFISFCDIISKFKFDSLVLQFWTFWLLFRSSGSSCTALMNFFGPFLSFLNFLDRKGGLNYNQSLIWIFKPVFEIFWSVLLLPFLLNLILILLFNKRELKRALIILLPSFHWIIMWQWFHIFRSL